MNSIALLGIGNILEKDDGVAIYATQYLQKNYTFSPSIEIINGGVEGINLLNLFMEYEEILILDAIEIEDDPGSIYHIPSEKLTGYGLNSGGAHEIGVLQCFDILELMAKPLPKSSVIGIVPAEIDVSIALSSVIEEKFLTYIKTIINILKTKNIQVETREDSESLITIIENFRDPRRGTIQEE